MAVLTKVSQFNIYCDRYLLIIFFVLLKFQYLITLIVKRGEQKVNNNV